MVDKKLSELFVDILGFSFTRGDTLGEVRKHGAGLYVANGISAVALQLELGNVAGVHLLNYDLYVICVYRPPSYDTEQNLILLEFLGEFVTGKEVIILGDFNLPSLDWTLDDVLDRYVTPTDEMFYSGFMEAGLVQWVREGTFFPSGNVLDLVLTTEDDRVIDVSYDPPLPRCHHAPVIIQYIVNDNAVGFH